MSITASPLPGPRLPGIGFEAVRVSAPSALRTDVAIFIGRGQRGPVGEPTRIDGLRAFQAAFGDFLPTADTPLAIKGFFDNGGRQAWMLRLAPGATPAAKTWRIGEGFVPPGLGVGALRIVAASPGVWGNALSVVPVVRRVPLGLVLDLEVSQSGRIAERISDLPLASIDDLTAAVAARSLLVRLEVDPAAQPMLSPGAGPTRFAWPAVTLADGSDGGAADEDAYAAALATAMELAEPALVVMPDLHRDAGDDRAAARILLAAARMADAQLDRLVIASAPESLRDDIGFAQWMALFEQDPAVHRAVAAYHPWLAVHDPIGDARRPLRVVPPCGHVAGAIARSDLAKGAYVTPANIPLEEVVDTSRRLDPDSRLALAEGGLNLLDCQSGRGMVIWGGRMLRSDNDPPRFVAHRRFLQRLVRALRATWAPMVFEPNDDMLRYTIARQATSLLLEAFHAGILKGTRPDEAFAVDVGDRLNDDAARASGKLFCAIGVALAVPMEFIQIRISLSIDGTVELVEP